MKRLLLLTASMLFITSLVFAQAGSIGVFMDTGGLNCDLDNTVGFMQVQCVHVYTPGASGCQFMLQVVGTPLMYVGEMSPFPTVIGNSQTGVAIAYGNCRVSPIHVLTVTYMGISPPCDQIIVTDDPTATPPGVYVTDCAYPVPNLLEATGGYGNINDDGNCPCTFPSEETSWGQVKALYQ